MLTWQMERLSTDHDEMVNVSIRISDGLRAGYMEGFLYPDEIVKFGNELQGFPGSMDHEVTLGAVGTPEHSWFKIAALVLNPSSAALEVHMQEGGDPPGRCSSHFYVPTEAANLNRLGKAIAAWDPETCGEFVYPRDDGQVAE